jgi:hypothetical protein
MMKFEKRFWLVLGLLILGSSGRSEAARVGHYTVDIEGQAESGFRVGDFLAALNGWHCHAVSSVTYSEERIDHHGARKLVPQKSTSDLTFSLISSPRVSGIFQRDMSIARNDVVASIGEQCWRTVDKPSICTRYVDGNAEQYACIETVREDASLFWNCEFPNLPAEIGQTTLQNCSKMPMPIGTSTSAYLMMGLKLKDFRATMRLEKVEEVFRARLCSSDQPAARYLIQLQGGVGGHVGEDDFRFRVSVNGQAVPEFRVNSGLLNEEILYCADRDEQSLRIKVGAIEKDLFFDDVYTSADEPISVESSAGSSVDPRILKIRRDTYLGEWFTDRNHEIRVRVKKLP